MTYSITLSAAISYEEYSRGTFLVEVSAGPGGEVHALVVLQVGDGSNVKVYQGGACAGLGGYDDMGIRQSATFKNALNNGSR